MSSNKRYSKSVMMLSGALVLGCTLSHATGASAVGKNAVVALTDNEATLTAAQLVNNTLFNIYTMGTARALTMDTGPNIATAYSCEVLGSSSEFAIWNRGAQSATLTARASAKLTGTGDVGIGRIVNCRSTHQNII